MKRHLLNKDIVKYFSQVRNSLQIFNIDVDWFSILKDIAIIQSFYGTDIDRISATTNALKAMVQSTVFPSEWIFVEGQENEDDCCFKWLNTYGIKHVFVKLTNQQKNLFLKTPLWNIGVQNSKSNRLCFIDSDISFCNSSWLQDVNDQFDLGVQVMSLHGYSYYENQVKISELKESIGHIAKANLSINSGHYGFTIGMTRDTFNEINGFDCAGILDDLVYWSKITGKNYIQNGDLWLPFENNYEGYSFKCGATEQTICHCDHGEISNRKYRILTDIIKDKINSFDDIIEYSPGKSDTLPRRRTDTKLSQAIWNAVDQVSEYNESETNGQRLYFESAIQEFGKINEKNPLIICTVFRKSFKYDVDNLLKFESELLQKCLNDFSLVCFSNEDLTKYNIDQIPLDNTIDENLDFLQIFRKDVKFPKNSNILFIPIDTSIKNTFECCRNDDEITINKKFKDIIYFKYSKNILNDIKKYKQIGRNVEEFLYFNQKTYSSLNKYIMFNN